MQLGVMLTVEEYEDFLRMRDEYLRLLSDYNRVREPEMITVREAAYRLGMSVNGVLAAIRREQLRRGAGLVAVRVNERGDYRISTKDLELYAQRSRKRIEGRE